MTIRPTTDSRKAIARTAVIATATGLVALALAAPASADTYIEVPHCSQVGSELCPGIEGFSFFNTNQSVKAEFTANANHCSDIIAHVMVDGREWGSNVVHPGQSDGGYEIPLNYGSHFIGIQAEGVDGGCNPPGVGPGNTLSAWGGTLHVEGLGGPAPGSPPPCDPNVDICVH